MGAGPLERRTGSELRGVRVKLVDGDGEIVDETGPNVVLNYDGDTLVRLTSYVTCHDHLPGHPHLVLRLPQFPIPILCRATTCPFGVSS